MISKAANPSVSSCYHEGPKRKLSFEQLENRKLLAADITFADEMRFVTTGRPTGIEIGDLDGDGDLDLAVPHSIVPQNMFGVTVMLNNGEGEFFQRRNLRAGRAPEAVEAADLNGDGYLDLAVANRLQHGISVLLGKGGGKFENTVNYDLGVDPWSVVALDFDRDGDLDLAAVSTFDDDVSILLNKGDGTFDVFESYPTGDGPSWVAAGDFDGDGHLDLVTPNTARARIPELGDISLLKGNGDGTFNPASRIVTGAEDPAGVVAGDFDGDGDLDLAVMNWAYFGGPGDVSVLLNRGDGSFKQLDFTDAGNTPNFIAAGDLDRDGDLDLVVTNWKADTVSVLQGNGDGTFGQPIGFAVVKQPVRVAVGDLDGDGDLDLAVANERPGLGGISVLLNTTVPAIQPPPPTFDSNGDGVFNQLDIVRVLQGAKYLTGEPATLAEGDWDRDGVFDQFDIIAALASGIYLQGPNASRAVALEFDEVF